MRMISPSAVSARLSRTGERRRASGNAKRCVPASTQLFLATPRYLATQPVQATVTPCLHVNTSSVDHPQSSANLAALTA